MLSMNKEKPIIDKEKELTLENVKEYFENEAKAYSEKSREKITDSLLHFKLIERWKEVNGYEKCETIKGKEKKEKIPGLLDKFEQGDYEPCSCYIEEILGGGGAEQETNSYDLINHKEYGSHTFKNREDDIKSPEYQQQKDRLRKLADFLAGELHKKRKAELNENLSPNEILNVLEHIANQSGKNLEDVSRELEKGNYKKILEYLDRQIYQQLLIRKNDTEKKPRKKLRDERMFELRRKRRYFLNLKIKNK